MKRSLASLLAVVVMYPALIEAQEAERSPRWGLAASFTPRWTAAPAVAEYVGADQYDISGSEFTIGFVRGRDYQGDWGVSFVWKSVSQDSISRFGTRQVCIRGTCIQEGTTVVAKTVSLPGLEAHTFLKLVAFGRRAHLGVNVAGGILRAIGKTERSEQFAGFEVDPVAGTVLASQQSRVFEAGGGQIFTTAKDVRYVPLMKLELGVGLVLTRNVKTRIAGGISFPGYPLFSVSAVYLLGRPGPQSIFR